MNRFFLKIAVFILLLLTYLAITPKKVFAEVCSPMIITEPITPYLQEGEFSQIKFKFTVSDKAAEYLIHPVEDIWPYRYDSGYISPDENGIIAPEEAIKNSELIKEGIHVLAVIRKDSGGVYCTLTYPVGPIPAEKRCNLSHSSSGTPGYTPNDEISISGTNLPNDDITLFITNSDETIVITKYICSDGFSYGFLPCNDRVINRAFTINLGKLNVGSYTVKPQATSSECKQISFPITETGGNDAIPVDKIDFEKLCQNDQECLDCFASESSVWTAIGCIPATDPNKFVGWVLNKLIFIASGIAFLLMVFGAIQILTSAGSPEKVKAGSELITSALSGLLLIIFAVFLLKLIGVDILHIPGF